MSVVSVFSAYCILLEGTSYNQYYYWFTICVRVCEPQLSYGCDFFFFFHPSPIVQTIDTNFYAVCSQQEVTNVMGQIQYGRGTNGHK